MRFWEVSVHPDSILKSLDAAPRKRWSQNFLVSPHWAVELVQRVLEGNRQQIVWEIGPGLGALSRVLLEKAEVPVTLFEIDPKLSGYLRQEFPMVKLVEGDFLQCDLREHLEPQGEKKRLSVLSNLPYHLSSPILFRLVELRDRLENVVLTFQREFAERLFAQPNTKDYGALTVVIQSVFEIERIGVIPPGAFFPSPTIDSEALRFRPRARLAPKHLSAVVHAAFSQRRKKMISNLKREFSNLPFEAIFRSLDLNPNVRAEALSLTEFERLADALEKHGLE
jgi:16S rRNA (adenine1518-N6/adenine1519-N6)-dimethyltransferase